MTAHIGDVVHYPDPKGTAFGKPLEKLTASIPMRSSWEMGQLNSLSLYAYLSPPSGTHSRSVF